MCSLIVWLLAPFKLTPNDRIKNEKEAHTYILYDSLYKYLYGQSGYTLRKIAKRGTTYGTAYEKKGYVVLIPVILYSMYTRKNESSNA